MTQARWLKRTLAAGVCAAIGAAAGIAGSAAAPGHTTKAAAGPGVMSVKLGFVGGPPVHATDVIPNKAGTGFDMITDDSGTATAVSGDSLTLTEGTDKATYAKPMLTIPAGATIERNFAPAKLADIQAGDHVDVSQSSDATTHVFAVDSAHWPPKPPAGAEFGVATKMIGPGKPGAPVSGVAYGFTGP